MFIMRRVRQVVPSKGRRSRTSTVFTPLEVKLSDTRHRQNSDPILFCSTEKVLRGVDFHENIITSMKRGRKVLLGSYNSEYI